MATKKSQEENTLMPIYLTDSRNWLLRRDEGFLAVGGRQAEDARDQRGHVVDVPGQQAEGAVLRFGHDLHRLLFEQDPGGHDELYAHPHALPTSSTLPIMYSAFSGWPENSSSRMRSQPSSVSSRFTIFPSRPVNCSVVKKGCVRKRSSRRAR